MANRVNWMVGLGAVLTAASAAQVRAATIPVVVNGTQLSSDALMIQNAGRTVLPMRTLFEALGAHVEWDSTERAVYAWRDDQIGVRLALGDRFAQTLRMARDPHPGNWGQVLETHPLEAPATMITGRIFVPIRFAAESLNASVRFISSENRIYINTQGVASARTTPPADTEEDRHDEDRAPVDRRGNRLPDDRRVDDRRVDDRRVDDRRVDDRRVDDRRVDDRIGDDRRVDDRRVDDRRADDRLPADRRADDRRPDIDPPVIRRSPASVTNLADALDVSLQVEPSRVRDGVDIPLRLVVRNTSNYSVTIPFRTQQFDFQVLDRGHLLWSWSTDRAVTRRSGPLTLKPGEEVEFSARWDGETNHGEEVEAGRYTVRGIFFLPGRQPRLISEETITVRR